jgi:hypothetical protein
VDLKDTECGMHSNDSGWNPVVGSFEDRIEPLVSIKTAKLLDSLNGIWLRKKRPALGMSVSL